MSLGTTKAELDAYAAKLKGAEVHAFHSELVPNTCVLLTFVANHLEIVDSNCGYTIQWAPDFPVVVKALDTAAASVERVFQQLVLVARELSIQSGTIDYELIKVFDFVDKIYSERPLQYQFYELFKYEIYKQAIVREHDVYRKTKDKVEKDNAELLQRLQKTIETVEKLQHQLNTQHKNYNFVGLSRAFSELLNEKKQSKYYLTIAIIALATVLLVVPIAAPWVAANFFDYAQVFGGAITITDLPGRFFAAIPFVAIEGVLIYLFRILLGNYYNMKSQITQLELRYGICQFVEGYLEFRGKFDPSCASRFETLIFGDLDRQNANTPNPFDFDSIAKIVEALKKR